MDRAKSLIAASARGVQVNVTMEPSQAAHSSAAKFLFQNVNKNLAIRLHSGRVPGGVLHEKMSSWDDLFSEDGSYNYTNNADLNWEHADFNVAEEQPEIVSDISAEIDYLFQTGSEPKSTDFMPNPAAPPNPADEGDTNEGGQQKS